MKRFATLCTFALLVPTVGLALDHAPRDFEGTAILQGPGGITGLEPTLDSIQANVFTPSCALSFCHGESMQANLDLREGVSYFSLVGVPSVEVPTALRVEPFDADASYLICKLEDCPWIVGSQMPVIGDPLTQGTIDVVREWIDTGALQYPPVSVESSTWGRVKALYRR